MSGTETSAQVLVTACSSPEDCDQVAALCGSSFPEEVYSQGLSVQQWASIEAEDLKNTPSWWRQIGLAREGPGGKLLGVVVLTLEHEADEPMTWSEYSRRVGCGPTILSWLYDHVLDERLLEHECLIDFIAVSPDARGKGVGAKLMQWAEQTGAAILAETETAAVAAHGVDMTLWVAADNTVACRLYQRSGYSVVQRTGSGACSCMAGYVLKWFLGHPVWLKMRKQLPAPEHLAAIKPQQQAIPLAVAAGLAASAASGAPDGDASFVDVPLGLPATRDCLQQLQPGGSSNQRTTAAAGEPKPAAADQGAPACSAGARLSRKQQKKASHVATASSAAGEMNPAQQQHPATPKIAAVGGWLRLGRQDGGQGQDASQQSGRSKDGQTLQLHAMPSNNTMPPGDDKTAALCSAAMDSAATRPWAPSVASASVASIATSTVDSDSEGEQEAPPGSLAASSTRAASRLAAAGTAGPAVFELVRLEPDAAGAPA